MLIKKQFEGSLVEFITWCKESNGGEVPGNLLILWDKEVDEGPYRQLVKLFNVHCEEERARQEKLGNEGAAARVMGIGFWDAMGAMSLAAINKINAIKYVRQMSGVGLKESKDLVEALVNLCKHEL